MFKTRKYLLEKHIYFLANLDKNGFFVIMSLIKGREYTMKKFKFFAVSILSLMMILTCFALVGCFGPEPEPEPEQQGFVIKFTVTFDLNYTGAPEATTQRIVRNGKVDKPADPQRSGYTFDGWYTRANGSGNPYNFETSAITADTTLYAKWSPVMYTVTINYNYTGAPAAATQEIANGGTLNKPADPSRTGYAFNGWYTRASGGTEITFPLTITGATTIYAHWSEAVDPSPSV